MKFPYHVVHNGVSYPIGTDVPIEETNGGGLNAPVVDVSGKADEVKDDKPEVKDDVKPEKVETRKYTEEELDVPFFSLKAMAKKEGLTLPEKAKASEIREMLRAL